MDSAGAWGRGSTVTTGSGAGWASGEGAWGAGSTLGGWTGEGGGGEVTEGPGMGEALSLGRAKGLMPVR